MGKNLEIQAVRIFYGDAKTFDVVNCYAPQDAVVVNLGPVISKLNEDLVIAGDFNASHDLWSHDWELSGPRASRDKLSRGYQI